MKPTFISIILLLLLSATSCRKSYSCHCSLPEGYLGPPSLIEREYDVTVKATSQQKAQIECEQANVQRRGYNCVLR